MKFKISEKLDSDYTKDSDSQKSVTGVVMELEDAPVIKGEQLERQWCYQLLKQLSSDSSTRHDFCMPCD